MMGWRNGLLRALAALAAALLAVPAAAQTFTVNALTANAPHLGTVAAGASAQTLFELNSAGSATTVVSGPGGIANGTGRIRATITIRCTGSCNSSSVATVTIANSGSPNARGAAVTQWDVVAGASTIIDSESGTSTYTVVMRGWSAANQNRTLLLSGRLPVNGDNVSTLTSATAPYTVTVTGGSNRTSTFTATVRRSISVNKVDDLQFGSVRMPASGSGTVTMAVGSDTPTGAGGVALFTDLPRSRAEFTITGQASTAVAMSVSASPITLANGGNNLSSTLTLSAATGTLSAGGTLTVFVGGVLTVPSTAVGGTYTGSFTFTANYN